MNVERAGAAAHAPGKVICMVYGAALAVSAVADAASYVPALRRAVELANTALGPLPAVLGMAWLYAAWKGVPASHRGTISPRRAALSMLIPFYNAYWAIAVNLALCETLDGILARVGSERRAPRALGLIACVTWLGSIVIGADLVAAHDPSLVWYPFVASYATRALWLAYMVACDRARDAVARLGDRVATLGPPRLSEVQRQPAPRALAVVCVLLSLIILLAVWNALTPELATSHPT